MSYEPNVWVSGNRITAEKLNHMEEGISSASGGGTPLIVNVNSSTLDKTWQEIHDALASGTTVYTKTTYSDEYETFATLLPVVEATTYNGTFKVESIEIVDHQVSVGIYGTDSASGYPQMAS